MLRRYLRERDALNAQVVAASPVARWSYPRWWIGRVEADHPQHWQAILDAGNERPPLTLRVNRRATTREALVGRVRRAPASTHVPVGAAGLIVDAAAAGDRTARLCRRRVLGAGRGRATGRAAAGARATACACSTRARRPAARPRTSPELADVELTGRSTATRRGSTRVRENLARLRLAGPIVRMVAGDAGAARRLVGRPAVRPHPGRRPVHGVGHRAPPSGRQVAAAQDATSRPSPRSSGASSPALWPLLAPGGLPAVRDLLGVCGGKRAADQ